MFSSPYFLQRPRFSLKTAGNQGARAHSCWWNRVSCCRVLPQRKLESTEDEQSALLDITRHFCHWGMCIWEVVSVFNQYSDSGTLWGNLRCGLQNWSIINLPLTEHIFINHYWILLTLGQLCLLHIETPLNSGMQGSQTTGGQPFYCLCVITNIFRMRVSDLDNNPETILGLSSEAFCYQWTIFCGKNLGNRDSESKSD
jgi:hypothetical protein